MTEGPCLEDYLISEAVNLWAKKKNRRLSTILFCQLLHSLSQVSIKKNKQISFDTEYRNGLHIIIDVLGGLWHLTKARTRSYHAGSLRSR